MSTCIAMDLPVSNPCNVLHAQDFINFTMTETKQRIIGSCCHALGITEEGLLGNDDLPQLEEPGKLTNEVVAEMVTFRKRRGIPWKKFGI